MKNIIILLLLVFCSSLSATSQSIVQLEEMAINKAQQDYSAPIKNKAVNGETLSVAGQTYKNGIGVHAPFSLKIKVNDGRRFKAKIGVNDNQVNYKKASIQSVPLTNGQRIFYDITASQKQFVGIDGKSGTVGKGSVVFRLLHNGKEIYNSGVMRQGEAVKEIDIPLKRGVLELLVDDAGDGVSGDHAVWLNPTIDYFEVMPLIVEPEFVGEPLEMEPAVRQLLENRLEQLPIVDLPLKAPENDWLINNETFKAEVYQLNNGKDLVITNGLIARTFRVVPNLATIDFFNQMTGESLLRAVSPEGMVTIDGKAYSIGGLTKQPEYAYTLNQWIDDLKALPNSFQVKDFEVRELTDRLEWKRTRWAGNDKMPTGKDLMFTLENDGIVADVHFELYDGLPTISKWIEFSNQSPMMVQLNSFKLEQLAMVEGESLVDIPKHWVKPNIHIESDYAFGAMQQKTSDKTTYWVTDARYTSQTNYPLQLPCVLEVKPPLGPDTAIPTGGQLSTFRVWETPMDSRDEERRGLFIRKMYRTISPWTTENPIFLHLTSSDPSTIKKAVEQCAETGYEMIILSFGSRLNMEKESAKYYQKYKELREYANERGVELGGYSLLSSRWVSDEVDVINPKTGKRGGMIFGSSPCLCSEWGYDYFRKIKTFFTETGMQVFENDGSYPGNVCASTTHAHHNGLNDSQWKQYEQIQGLYKWMRSRGIYMNVPDFYVNSGSNKTGIGYREVNWSLPRERQAVLGRQNIYDGLWTRIPSMCWTFVPLTQYHGGGAAATMEPLKEHLHDYENQMMQNYGAGVQACYRGPRLYDAPETKELVVKTINWYKQYRDILNSDIIHLRRPSGRDWDGFLHGNPDLDEKGLAMLFNPTNQAVEREISLPLYYTGLTDKARVREKEGNSTVYKLSRDYTIKVKVVIPALSYTWLVIE